MKSYLHHYKGYGIHPSVCRVYIREVENETWIGFENLGEGTSVTNASEQLATEIVQREDLRPEYCKFFEWYWEEGYKGREVSIIKYHWEGLNADSPDWRYYCKAEENPFKE